MQFSLIGSVGVATPVRVPRTDRCRWSRPARGASRCPEHHLAIADQPSAHASLAAPTAAPCTGRYGTVLRTGPPVNDHKVPVRIESIQTTQNVVINIRWRTDRRDHRHGEAAVWV